MASAALTGTLGKVALGEVDSVEAGLIELREPGIWLLYECPFAVEDEASGAASTRPLLLINDLRERRISGLKQRSAGKHGILQLLEKSGVSVSQPDVGHIRLLGDKPSVVVSGWRLERSHLVNIVSNHSRKVILLAQPVLLHLHLPATLNNRVSGQFTHVCRYGVSAPCRTLDR